MTWLVTRKDLFNLLRQELVAFYAPLVGAIMESKNIQLILDFLPKVEHRTCDLHAGANKKNKTCNNRKTWNWIRPRCTLSFWIVRN